MEITIEEMIYTAAKFRKTNVAEIARAMGVSPSVLYKKIYRNTLKPWELAKIAQTLDGEYHFYFSFPNGSKIGALDKKKQALIANETT